MPALPQLWAHSTGPVGTTPGPKHPQSRHERRSPHLSLVLSMASSHHSQEIPQLQSPLAGTPFFNLLCHVLQQFPLALIREHLHTTGFTPTSSSTPYGKLAGDPLSEYPLASPTREAPSVFITPLSQIMHCRSEAPTHPCVVKVQPCSWHPTHWPTL